MNTIRITGDGAYPIPREAKGGNADKLIILPSGTYGTATVHLNIYNGNGNLVPLDGGELDVNVQRVLHQGSTLKIAAVVTGSDGTTNIVLDTEETG